MERREKGAIHIFLLVLTIIILAIAIIFSAINFPKKPASHSQNLSGIFQKTNNPVGWAQDENGWKPVGTPPPCPNPLILAFPIDIKKATSVLYPGQMRSVGYENTAGFRFDGLPNESIAVVAPIDGKIVQAARFTVGEEIQYVFDIISPCGIMTRFDHLLMLSEKLQRIADTLPEPKEGDNRSTSVNPAIDISQGEILATAVGIKKDNNTFVAWTMFDLRNKNKISQDPAWANEHPSLDHYAVCPYDYLSEEDQEVIKSLPAADSISGSESDFCD